MWVCPSARARPSDLAGVSRPPDRLRMSAARLRGNCTDAIAIGDPTLQSRGMKATEPTRHFLLWPRGAFPNPRRARAREGGNECKTPSPLL